MSKPLLISATVLLGANLFALACAIWFDWNLFEVVLLYWIQALIIVVFHRRKIRDMIECATQPHLAEWFRANRTPLMQMGMHNAVAGILGAFWAGVGITLGVTLWNTEGARVDPLTILLVSSIFLLSHWWSYRANKESDKRRIVDLNILLLPLFRIILPLQVFLIVMDLDVTSGPVAVAVWMSIKTAADIGGHVVEHGHTKRIPATV